MNRIFHARIAWYQYFLLAVLTVNAVGALWCKYILPTVLFMLCLLYTSFTETADQEKEHAKRMFKFLEGGMVEITASYPAGVIGNTLENLRAAAAGEHEEWSLDYPHFADVAEQEGFPMIAAMYRNISIAEKGHEERYLAFMNNIENMTVFAKEGEVVWQCRNCGYIEIGKEAPEVCPACLHPQAYFEVKKENY